MYVENTDRFSLKVQDNDNSKTKHVNWMDWKPLYIERMCLIVIAFVIIT